MDEVWDPAKERTGRASDSQSEDNDLPPLENSSDDQVYTFQSQIDDRVDFDHELDEGTFDPLSGGIQAHQNVGPPVSDTEAQNISDCPQEDESFNASQCIETEHSYPHDEAEPLQASDDPNIVTDYQKCFPCTPHVHWSSTEPTAADVEHEDVEEEEEEQEEQDNGHLDDTLSHEVTVRGGPCHSEMIAMPEYEPDNQTTPSPTPDSRGDADFPYNEEIRATRSPHSDQQSPEESEPTSRPADEEHQNEAPEQTDQSVEENPEMLMTAGTSVLDPFEDLECLPEIANYECITSTEHESPRATMHGVDHASPTLFTMPAVVESLKDRQVYPVETIADEEHEYTELANTVPTASSAFEHIPFNVVPEMEPEDGLCASKTTECVTTNQTVLPSDDGPSAASSPPFVIADIVEEPAITRENAASESQQSDIPHEQGLVVDTTEPLQNGCSYVNMLNDTPSPKVAGEDGHQPAYSPAYDYGYSTIAMKSRTFDTRQLDDWESRQQQYKARAATLGPSGTRKRPALRPKPAINDDHLFPDSVTPTKVEPLLKAQSVSKGLPDGTYDLPYMDDDAFLRKYRGGIHDEESINDSVDDPFMWTTAHIDPEHLANTDECAPTPLITPKNKRRERAKGKRQKIDNNTGRKSTRIPVICCCLSKKRSR